jgi:hypothetical protein
MSEWKERLRVGLGGLHADRGIPPNVVNIISELLVVIDRGIERRRLM